MITADYARHMARYNRWQNQSLIDAADGLDEQARDQDRGAFWGSIHGTFSHLLWGDTIWIARFDGGEGLDESISESGTYAVDWETFKTLRAAMDARIVRWATGLKDAELEGTLSWYSGAVKRQMEMPKAVCVMQFFNHQTHHRGQVHAMLTAAGATPGDTDLPFMPETV